VLDAARVHEDASENLAGWLAAGYQSMPLVHVSGRDALAHITDDRMELLRNMVKKGDLQALRAKTGRVTDSLLDDTNYLFAAVRLGVIREVFWVVPFRIVEQAGGGQRLKAFLRASGTVFPDGEIDAMRMFGGCLGGHLNGIPVRICSPSTLPSTPEPMILDMGVGFIPTYAYENSLSKLRGLKIFFDHLSGRGFRFVSPGISYGSVTQGLKPFDRYLAGDIASILGDPAILLRESPSDLWLARDTAENMLSGGGYEEALEHLQDAMEAFPDDPVLKVLKAVVLAHLGKGTESLEIASAVCGDGFEDGCYALVYIGSEGITDGSEEFLRKALELKPDWSYAQIHLAEFLASEGRYKDAAKYMSHALEKVEDGVLRFRLGDMLYRLDRKSEARGSYERGLSLLPESVGIPLKRENLESLEALEEIYRAEGRPADVRYVSGRIGRLKERAGLVPSDATGTPPREGRPTGRAATD